MVGPDDFDRAGNLGLLLVDGVLAREVTVGEFTRRVAPWPEIPAAIARRLMQRTALAGIPPRGLWASAGRRAGPARAVALR